MKKKIDIAKQKSWQNIADDIREAIASGRLKPGEMLQGEQGLAFQYEAGLYSIRSAIKSLKDAGVLYSIPKKGIYVSGMQKAASAPEVQVPVEEVGESYEQRDVVHYVTRSGLPLQREIYEEMARAYSSTSISSCLKVIYNHGDASQLHPKSDIYEYGSSSRFCFSNTPFVDLKKYFSHIIHSPEKMYNSSSIPLFRSVPLVIYNKNLLKKLGFTQPDYDSFEEQMAFLDDLTSRIALQSSYCMPGTTQNMVQKCGNIRRELYKDIVEFKLSVADAREKYSDIIQRMTRYWRKYHISYPGRTAQIEAEFAAGRSPLFFGLSSHFIRFMCQKLPFDMGASVMLSHDNTVDNDLGLVSIDMDTPKLVDAARFVNFIQADEYQFRFASLGYMPMLETAREKMPVDNAAKGLELAYPLIFASPEEYYITINIINVELWNIVLFEKSVEDAIESIFSFSRSYLQMKLDKAAIDTQTMKSGVYL